MSPFFVFVPRLLLIIKIILEDIRVLRTHELVDYGGLAHLPAAKEDDPEGFGLVPECPAGDLNSGLIVDPDLHTVGRASLGGRLVSVVFPPEGVAPIDDLGVGGQKLAGDLHVVDGETVGPAAALLMINKCQSQARPSSVPGKCLSFLLSAL